MSNYIRTLQLLRRIEDALHEMAESAGDVPEWNDGGHGYDAYDAVGELRRQLERPERDDGERDFTVSWATTLTGPDVITAALTARDYVVDSDSTATVYTVDDTANNERVIVDLAAPDETPFIVRREPLVK